jgi:hypothetical protein
MTYYRIGLWVAVTLATVSVVLAADPLDRFPSLGQPAGRDYEYTLTEVRPDPTRHPGLGYLGGDPFVTHSLDGRPETWLTGGFLVPAGAKQFRGMAVKVSRDGRPGPLELRFGSAPGKYDFGTAQIKTDIVLPLYDVWHEARIDPRAVQADQPVYWQIRASAGADPDDHFIVYGPRSDGGRSTSQPFALAYRVLTDRPQDRIEVPGKQYTFQHVKKLLGPYYTDDPLLRLHGKPPGSLLKKGTGSELTYVNTAEKAYCEVPVPVFQQAAGAGETAIDAGWAVHYTTDPAGVMATAARDLAQFLSVRAGVTVPTTADPARAKPRTIDLVLSDDAEFRKAINTEEGYRVEVKPDRVVVLAQHPRGAMRGVYWIEEMMQFRGAPCLQQGVTDRNCRFRRRLTTSISIAEMTYDMTTYPMVYTDGLLQAISHQGFNAIWFYMNVEEVTFDSRIFPELNDPKAKRRLTRLRDLIARARPLGIDVIPYFGTNNHLPVPESFYAKHPDCRGVGWLNSMCTSHPDVQRYFDETVGKLFEAVPGLKGLVLIFDSEGFFHCAVGEQRNCPRCRDRRPADIVVEFISTISSAMKSVNPDAELIAWSYGGAIAPKWVDDVIPRLPKGTIFQADFGKGAPVVRDGITNITEDYNITTIGPPAGFLHHYAIAKKAGIKVMTKTEHAVSQEFITVPYIPCMRQWHDRVAKMAEYDLDGYLGNWNHYGYMPSRPAEILMWYSWTNAPPWDDLLARIARRDFGDRATKHVIDAWEHFTRGIQRFPYSDPIARYPGPLQKGPSQPLFLDPKVPGGNGRSWQNNLDWTRPWGPAVASKYLQQVADEFSAGLDDLRAARDVASPAGKMDLDGEIRIVDMLRRSLHSMVNLIRWIPVRDAYAAAASDAQRQSLREQLVVIARDELANAQAALTLAEADSRLGAASEAAGSRRGGLYTPALIRVKIKMLQDMLERQLAG